MSPSGGHFSLSSPSLKLVCLFHTTLGEFDFKKPHHTILLSLQAFFKKIIICLSPNVNTSSGSLLFIQFSPDLPAFPGPHAFSSPFDILLIQLGTVSKSSPFRTPIPQKCLTQYFVVEMVHREPEKWNDLPKVIPLISGRGKTERQPLEMCLSHSFLPFAPSPAL